MTQPPRDWDRELADIDKAMDKQGSGPTAPRVGGAVAPRPAPAVVTTARGSVAITWLWVLFAVALAVALPLWPYQRVCGLQAFFFLGAAGVTVVVGGLAALSSWANRRGFAHVLSLLVVAWGAAVAAREILPRVGYAREVRTWTCATPAATSRGTTAPAGTVPAAPAPATSAPTAPAPATSAPADPAPQSRAAPAPAAESAPAEGARPDSAAVSR